MFVSENFFVDDASIQEKKRVDISTDVIVSLKIFGQGVANRPMHLEIM